MDSGGEGVSVDSSRQRRERSCLVVGHQHAELQQRGGGCGVWLWCARGGGVSGGRGRVTTVGHGHVRNERGTAAVWHLHRLAMNLENGRGRILTTAAACACLRHTCPLLTVRTAMYCRRESLPAPRVLPGIDGRGREEDRTRRGEKRRARGRSGNVQASELSER